MLVLALLLAAGAVRAQVDEATAEMLMRKSGMWQQLAELATQVRGGVQDASKQWPKQPSAEELQRIERAIGTAFAADRLRRLALQSLTSSLQPAHVERLRQWYGSPLGEKLTRLEEAAAASQNDTIAVASEGGALLETLPSVRQAQYYEMLEATQAAESMVQMLTAVTMAISQGVEAAKPTLPGPTAAELRGLLQARRPMMLKLFSALFMANAALTYRSLPDAELSPYVVFLKSDAGRHFTQATMAALQAVITDASVEFGRSLPAARDAANS